MNNELKVLDITYDGVVRSNLLHVKSNYKFAIEKLTPAIDRLDFNEANRIPNSMNALLLISSRDVLCHP